MITINNELCVNCMDCVNECPLGAFYTEEGSLKVNPAKCNYCGHCIAVCPRNALVIEEEDYYMDDVEEFYGRKADAASVRQLILTRRSVREYTDEEVTEDTLIQILEAGKYSPMQRNLQGNAFLVVTSEAERDHLLDVTAEFFNRKAEEIMDKMPGLGQFYKLKYTKYAEEEEDNFYYRAPVIIFVFADDIEDGAIAATNMGVMTNALGLGYCFAKAPTEIFEDEEIRAYYEIPENKKCVLAMLVGYSRNEYFCSVPRKDPLVIIK